MLGRWIPNPDQEPPDHTGDEDSRTPGTPGLDLSVLESRRGTQGEGQPDKLARIVTLFIDDVPLRLESFDGPSRGKTRET